MTWGATQVLPETPVTVTLAHQETMFFIHHRPMPVFKQTPFLFHKTKESSLPLIHTEPAALRVSLEFTITLPAIALLIIRVQTIMAG